MKLGFVNIAKFAAVVVSMVIVGSVNAWATCPTSPYYSPDFTTNASCLTLNPSASIPTPAGSAVSISAWSSTGTTVTFTTATNGFVAGEPVILSGFTNSPYFNTLVFPVQSFTTNSFTVAFIAPSGPTSGTETTAVATPMTVLQLTPNSASLAGSAWDMTPQTVGSAFSTTFYFQLSPSPGPNPGDGFAFVIQNSTAGTGAIGPDGCGEGFGGDTFLFHDCGASNAGIPNSIAVSFKTSLTDATHYPEINSVSIQNDNYSSAVNCVDKTCTIAENDLNLDTPPGPTLTDSNIHAATVTYAPTPTAAQISCKNGATPYPCLDVILDGVDLFPTGVPFDLTSLGLATGNTAYVGFTAGTSTNTEAADILSWVFTPAGASTTGNINTNNQTNFDFQGGYKQGNTTGYDFNAQLTSGNPVTAVVTAIPIKDQATCDGLLANSAFSTAKCFVYQNSGGPGLDQPVMFELTCPPAGECNSGAGTFPATLGSNFPFLTTDDGSNDNLNLALSNFPPDSLSPVSGTTAVTGYPAVGLLKGQGPDPIHPCTPYPSGSNIPLFQSNQISGFTLDPDTSGGAHGSSGDTNSCWVVTYLTPNELPTVSITAPSASVPFSVGPSSVSAVVSCSAVNNSNVNNGVVGPYLTVPDGSCTYPPTFDTSTPGSFTYTATVTDSALNTNYQTVTYTVQAPPTLGGPITDTFTVGTTGTYTTSTMPGAYPPPTTSITTGTLPAGLHFTDNGSGSFTIYGTPTGTGGSTALTITSSNGVGTAATESVTVVVNQAPAITTPTISTIPTFTGGTPGSIGVTTTGYPVVNTISLSPAAPTVTLPSWLTIGTVSNTGTATISVNPPLSISQTTQVTFTITASNGVSPNAAQTFTLTVNPGAQGVTISTSITGLTFAVNGTPYTSSHIFSNWTIGSTYTISVSATPQTLITSPKTEYTFNSWSDSGAISHLITVTAGVTSYVANFNTLYQLTTATSPAAGGTVTPPAGGPYYLAGSQPSVSATPAAGYTFSSWTFSPATSGSLTTNPTTVLMNAPETVTATFTALPATLTISPTSLNFPNQKNNTSSTQTVTLTNNGASAITISSIKIPGSNTEQDSAGDPDDFSFTKTCGSSLAAHASCYIYVTFSADNDNLKPYASLVITDGATGSPQSVPITSNIIDPLISLSSSSMSFGSVTHLTSAAKTVTVKNTGLTALTLSGLAISGTDFAFTTSPPPANSCTNTTVLNPGLTCVIGVTFSPAAKSSYSGQVTITSNALNGATAKISLSGSGK